MYKRLFKRLIDIITAVICLPFLLVILIFAAPLIKLADKGPIFYNAERIGKDGKLFKMYKFRSMMVNAPDIRLADGSTYNGEDDPRVTGIGKFLRKTSLDEAPQILNVLIGNMSLIGPRPDPPDWIDKYPEEIKVFLSVRPGITGYSQAYFRNSADGEEKMKNDAFYAENCSFNLDAEIFLKTIVIVLKRENTFKDVSNEQLFNVGESTLCKDNKKGNVSAEVS
jgi:undecaprenyl phosphate N,N'-diacetylbacillosamine 1-phosphate transferase